MQFYISTSTIWIFQFLHILANGIGILQRKRTTGIEKRFIMKGWLMIIEDEKSSEMLSASWRSRKASGIVPVQTQMSENQWD